MKKLALFAAVAALSACSQEADDAADTTATETPAPVDSMAMADTVTPGTYDVKMADGSMGTTVINADGTYTDTDAAGKAVSGTVTRKDGKDCFDPEGDEAEMCWTTTTPGADGSFTATGPDGTSVTVMPHAAAAATPAATETPAG